MQKGLLDYSSPFCYHSTMNAESFIDSFLEGFTKQAEADGVPEDIIRNLFSLHVSLCKCAQADERSGNDLSKSERVVMRKMLGADRHGSLEQYVADRDLHRLLLLALASGAGALVGGVGGSFANHGALGTALGGLAGAAGGYLGGNMAYPTYTRGDLINAAHSAGYDSVADYAAAITSKSK